MKKRTILALAAMLIAVRAFCADQVISLWGDADSYTAIILSGKQFFIQDEKGKRGPYAKVFPFDSKNASRRAWGVEGDEKKGYYLIGDGDQKFGPYQYISEYRDRDRQEGKASLIVCAKADGTKDLIFCDGERLTFMSTVADADYDFVDFDRERKTAALAVNHRSKIAIGSSIVSVPGKGIEATYGFLGEPETFWASFQENYGPFRLLSIPLDGKGHAERKIGYGSGVDERGLLGIDSFGGTGGSGYLSYSEDRSGMILKYRTPQGGFIFTGRETLGPYECDDAWLKARDGAISPDGKELVFPYKKGGETYLYFRGTTVGPYDGIIGNPWFIKDGTARAYALVMKGGKAYVLLDGGEIGGPWDEVKPIWGQRNIFMLLVKKNGQSLLYDTDAKAEEPLPAGMPGYFVKSGGQKAVIMSEGEYSSKTNPRKEWFVIDGKAQPKFDSVSFLSIIAPDGAPLVYLASQDFLWYVIAGDKKLGPYDQVGSPSFYKDGFAFPFRKGNKFFIGKSDGSSVALPFAPRELGTPSKLKVEAKDLGDLAVSEDGRIVQFDMALPVKGQGYPLNLHRVLVDGKAFVGHYDAASGTALIWDDKAKAAKRLASER